MLLSYQFIIQNLHFITSLFAGLVAFAMFWLYFDAWSTLHKRKELLKWLGCLILALGFLAHATLVEQAFLGNSGLGKATDLISQILRLVGYLLLAIGIASDPLEKEPDVTGVTPTFGGVFASFGSGLPVAGAAIACALLYFRRATTGLERHLRRVAIGFMFLGGSEMLHLASAWQNSSDPVASGVVAAFGPLWILEHALLLTGAVILGIWVWQYLTKRFLTQFFMVFTVSTMVIFTLTTVSFTALLLRNVQTEALANLSTANGVLSYAFASKQAETQSNAEALAQNQEIAAAITARDRAKLIAKTDKYLGQKQISSLVITTTSGQVLVRAEDSERWGDSLSNHPLVKRAVTGSAASGIGTREDIVAPQIQIESAVPVLDATGKVVGSVLAILIADDGFVSGIKQATGLDASIYAGSIRSATTLVGPDGNTRLAGIKETNEDLNRTVLVEGNDYKGETTVAGRGYLAVYSPLKDADNATVGMLFIGQPQITLLQTAGKSIQLTFLTAAILLVLSIIPAYLISRRIAYQVG